MHQNTFFNNDQRKFIFPDWFGLNLGFEWSISYTFFIFTGSAKILCFLKLWGNSIVEELCGKTFCIFMRIQMKSYEWGRSFRNSSLKLNSEHENPWIRYITLGWTNLRIYSTVRCIYLGKTLVYNNDVRLLKVSFHTYFSFQLKTFKTFTEILQNSILFCKYDPNRMTITIMTTIIAILIIKIMQGWLKQWELDVYCGNRSWKFFR